MKIYEQDTKIPIIITLSYIGKAFKIDSVPQMLTFPINPNELTKNIPSESENTTIEGIGEVSVPQKPKLSTVTIESFFWGSNKDAFSIPPAMYVAWLEKWQASKEVAHLVVTRLNISMQVTCESFTHTIKAGEEEDVYFKLELKEYRPYGAKKLNLIKDKGLLQQVKEWKNLAVLPVIFDVARPSRSTTSGKTIENPYTVMKDETLITITKKVTGSTSDWNTLYSENRDILGNAYNAGGAIPTGTKLNLPSKWVENSANNIVNVEV